MLTGNTYEANQCSTSVCSRWVATVRTPRCTLHLLEVSLRLCWGACYGDSVAVSSGGTGCPLRGWVIAYTRPDHSCNDWMILFVLHDPGDCLDESIGSFHQRLSLCEWPIKYDGNGHLFSIFLMRAGLPACICSRIATALFSQGFVPLLYSFALVIQFGVDHSERWGS